VRIVSFQQELRPDLPNVYGTSDYREFRETLTKIDAILTKSDLEHQIVTKALAQYVCDHQLNANLFYSSKNATFQYKKIRHALRCNIARHLTGESYRLFSIRLADSQLFQWFTGISAFGTRKATSKSSLERYEKYFDEVFISEEIKKWLSGFSDVKEADSLGLQKPIDFQKIFTDSTCVKANIHFPVDWVLLRDAARSLLLAIKTIRTQGLKHRMIEPSQLLKEMNKLCINMTHTRRKVNGKKERKNILRKIKKLSHCISRHAKNYRDLLAKDWKKTNWTLPQANQVIKRIDSILDQLPAAIKQAHERIIGERMPVSSDKILSLYDREAQVIIRGKPGNEVEFGQVLLLSEQSDGLIVDWHLFSGELPSDSQLLEPAISRIEKYYGKINSISADSAFWNEKSDSFLSGKNIYNAVRPRSQKLFLEKLKDEKFLLLQTRRSQTEARIGIFKNVFLGKPLRSRITLNKRHAINWCVLTHNLWVLSRKAITDERQLLNKAA
jgi:hypothetical protein